jgi:phosphoglucosamine mutase
MQEAVVAHGADIGLSLDGDADRLIVADETGRRLNGDQIVASIATYWQKIGKLSGGGVAMTVLSNTGLERYLNSLGLNLVRAQVGDRHVMQAMHAHGMNLGGEESGHFIALDYNTTGDGLMAALQVLAALQDSGKKASEMLRCFEPLPQIQKTVRYNPQHNPLNDSDLQAKLTVFEKEITATGGRMLIRKSGTEPVIRVMAEGDDVAQIDAWVAQMCQAIEAKVKAVA